MQGCKSNPADVLQAQALALVTAIAGGVREVENPQLGRVSYASTAELIAALNLVNGLLAALEGGTSRTQPVIALRGLWPRSIEGRIWE